MEYPVLIFVLWSPSQSNQHRPENGRIMYTGISLGRLLTP